MKFKNALINEDPEKRRLSVGDLADDEEINPKGYSRRQINYALTSLGVRFVKPVKVIF